MSTMKIASKTEDAVAKMAELEAAAIAAAAAESEASAEDHRRREAVPAAAARLTAAVTADAGVSEAAAELQAAQAAAGDLELPARIEGLRRARSHAESALNQHREENLGALIESLRPRAEAAVATVMAAIEQLEAATGLWGRCDAEVSRLTSRIQWFVPHARMPQDPFTGLRAELEKLRAGEIELPLPRNVDNPAQIQERADREYAEAMAASAEQIADARAARAAAGQR